MFDNIGGKIKTLVQTVFWIEVVLCVLFGMGLISNQRTMLIGLLILMAGIFLAWISSFVMYGFGELVENSQKQTQQNNTLIRLLKNKEDEVEHNSASITQVQSTGFNAMNIPNKD